MSDSQVLYIGPIENSTRQVLVASSEYKNDDADYYCTGTDDQILINTAIRYLAGTYGGGEVVLSEGAFELDDPIYLKSNIKLSGKGLSTILYGTATDSLVRTIDMSATANNIEICNLKASCVMVLAQYCDSNASIHDIRVTSVTWNGISISGVDSRVENNFIEEVGLYGIIVQADYAVVNNNTIYKECTGAALYISSNNNIVSNNVIRDCKRVGAAISGNNNIFQGNQVINCGWQKPTEFTQFYGIYIAGGSNTRVIGNNAQDNGNLIARNTCDNSSTSPMITGEAAPTTSNCTWAFTSTGPYDGDGQYRFSKTILAGTRADVHLVDNVGAADIHGMVAGTQYEYSGWFKCASSASGGYQGLRFYQVTTAGGATSATVVTIATASWQQVVVTATIYANATTAYIGIWASASLASTHTFDVDNLRLYQPGVGNAHNMNFYNLGTDTGSVNSWI